MSTKTPPTSGLGKYDSEAYRREQAFCLDALDSGEFDNLSDAEWIALCERVAQKKRPVKEEVATAMSEHHSGSAN